jgi:hypothetical protein
MTDILADYREWAANVPTRASTHNERCHLYHTECMVHRLARRLEEAELTDAEREAVASAIRWREIDAPADGDVVSRYCAARASTLRGLLERTGEK